MTRVQKRLTFCFLLLHAVCTLHANEKCLVDHDKASETKVEVCNYFGREMKIQHIKPLAKMKERFFKKQGAVRFFYPLKKTFSDHSEAITIAIDGIHASLVVGDEYAYDGHILSVGNVHNKNNLIQRGFYIHFDKVGPEVLERVKKSLTAHNKRSFNCVGDVCSILESAGLQIQNKSFLDAYRPVNLIKKIITGGLVDSTSNKPLKMEFYTTRLVPFEMLWKSIEASARLQSELLVTGSLGNYVTLPMALVGAVSMALQMDHSGQVTGLGALVTLTAACAIGLAMNDKIELGLEMHKQETINEYDFYPASRLFQDEGSALENSKQ